MPTILITGCSSGIGYDTAKQLHELGWTVYATCRQESDVQRLRQEGLQHACQLDVTDSAQIQRVVERIADENGLDALFCNAGFGQTGAVEDIPPQALKEQFETNVFGTWECIRQAMKIFRKQNSGRILVNSSILGFAAMAWRGAYNASKFALEGMCDTLRAEVHGSHIYVSLVEPGPIATRFRQNALVKFETYIDVTQSVHAQAYQQQLARLRKQGDAAPFTMSSPDCAKICVQALTARRPKARYAVTFPTKLFWWLRRVLPTTGYDWCLRKAVK